MAYGLRFLNDAGHPVVDYDASQVQIYKTLTGVEHGSISHAASSTIASHGDSGHAQYKGTNPIVLPQNIDRDEVFIFVAPYDLDNWGKAASVGVHYGTLKDCEYTVSTPNSYQGQTYIDISPGPSNFGHNGSAKHQPESYCGTAGLGLDRPCSDNRGSGRGTKIDAPDPVARDLIGASISISNASFSSAGPATVVGVQTGTYNNNPIIRLFLNKSITTSGSLFNGVVSFSDFDCFYLCDSTFQQFVNGEKFIVKIGMLNDLDDLSENNDRGIRIRNQYGSAQQTVFNFSTNREMFTGTDAPNTRTDQVVEFTSNNVLLENYVPPNHQRTVYGNFSDTFALMNPCFGCTAGYADNASVGSYSFSATSDTQVGWSPMITFKPSGVASPELSKIAFESGSSLYEPDDAVQGANQIFMSPGVINSKTNAGLNGSISHTWASQRPLIIGKIQ